MLKIRRPLGRLIFNMGIAIPGKTVFLIETAPWSIWDRNCLKPTGTWTPSSSLTIHYDDVIMGAIASLITSLTIVYSTVYSGADQSKHQSSTSLAFVWGIHRGPMNSPHKWPVTRKMFPFDDVIMSSYRGQTCLKERNAWHIGTCIFRYIYSNIGTQYSQFMEKRWYTGIQFPIFHWLGCRRCQNCLRNHRVSTG